MRRAAGEWVDPVIEAYKAGIDETLVVERLRRTAAQSIRGEVRFTHDVDLAIAAADDAETEALVRDLGAAGYAAVAVVEHDERRRLATVRLRAPTGIVVDLLAASSGIEREVVDRATRIAVGTAGMRPSSRTGAFTAGRTFGRGSTCSFRASPPLRIDEGPALPILRRENPEDRPS